MLLPLRVRPLNNPNYREPLHWSQAMPFVVNAYGVLIHRPRAIRQFKLLGKSHIGIDYWCGGHANGNKKFTFVDAPPAESIVCQRCEEAAVGVGERSSSEIAGRHVHLGGVKAFKTCCP